MNVPETIRAFAGEVSIIEVFIILLGIIIFGIWLVKTSLGRKALADSVHRPNNMPVYLPFIPLFIWFGAVATAVSITKEFLPGLPKWQTAFVNNIILGAGATGAIVVIILLARSCFVGGIKTLGLNLRTIPKDFVFAVVNLLGTLPIMFAMIMLTILLGKIIYGPQFEMSQHEELKLISQYPQLSLRILIVVVSCVIAPVCEEMLFRGMFQTMIRTYLVKPWRSIFITSGLFAMVHPNAGHWPALFILSVSMGYAYEKSGSLFRPVFIHALFNSAVVIAALYQ